MKKFLVLLLALSGNDPTAIFASYRRYVGHLHDAAQIKATALELLAALSAFAVAGKPLNDTLLTYVAAHRAAPGQTHGEAMARLGSDK